MLKDAFEAAFFLDLEFSSAQEMNRFLKDAEVEIYCHGEDTPRVKAAITDLDPTIETSEALTIEIHHFKKARDPDLSRITIRMGNEVRSYAIRRSGVPDSTFYEITN